MIRQLFFLIMLFVIAIKANANCVIIEKPLTSKTNYVSLDNSFFKLPIYKYINSRKISEKDTTIQTNDTIYSNQPYSPISRDFKDATRDIKVDLFGLFRGYTQITYEVSKGTENSMELSLGIIGIGNNSKFEYSDTMNHTGDHNKSQLGLFFGIGYKLNKLPLFEIGGDSGVHLLQGLYARPMFYFGAYDENRIAYVGNNQFQLLRPTTKFACLQIELGKQWVIKNRGLIDLYFGLGYGIDNKKYYSTSYYDYITTSSFNYCNDRIGKSPGISFTIGIKTGLLIH